MPPSDRTGAPQPSYRPWRERVAVALRLIERRDQPPTRVVIVAATPRSGSSMLCRTLRATGALGPTFEVLNHPDLLRFAFVWGVPHAPLTHQARQYLVRRRSPADAQPYPYDETSVRRYLQMVARRRLAADGTFGVKIQGLQFADTMQRLSIGPDVWGVPVTWVHLRRRDRIAQAVSLAKAHQTRQFSAAGRARGEAHYRADLIRIALRDLERGNAVWDSYFPAQGITPIEVWYEDLSADPEGEMRRVLDGIGRNDLTPHPPVTARQFDRTNEEWIERFKRDSTEAT